MVYVKICYKNEEHLLLEAASVQQAPNNDCSGRWLVVNTERGPLTLSRNDQNLDIVYVMSTTGDTIATYRASVAKRERLAA